MDVGSPQTARQRAMHFNTQTRFCRTKRNQRRELGASGIGCGHKVESKQAGVGACCRVWCGAVTPNPTLTGKVSLKAVILADGTVREVDVLSDNHTLRKCGGASCAALAISSL
jgi:hypothetical protein